MKLMMQNATGKRLSRIPAAYKVQRVIAATNFGVKLLQVSISNNKKIKQCVR